VFTLRKFHTEQIIVLVRIQLRCHVDTQPLKRYRSYALYERFQIWNVASAREWDSTAQMVRWSSAAEHLRGNIDYIQFL